jgi:hypothetical protein
MNTAPYKGADSDITSATGSHVCARRILLGVTLSNGLEVWLSQHSRAQWPCISPPKPHGSPPRLVYVHLQAESRSSMNEFTLAPVSGKALTS